MGLQVQDRQGQVDVFELCDVIDIVGSVALNARQPPPASASGSAVAQPCAPSENQATPASAVSGASDAFSPSETTVFKDFSKSNTFSDAKAAVHEQAEGADTHQPSCTGPVAGGAPDKVEDRESNRICVPPFRPTSASVCEVATLQQLFRTKLCNVALVSDVDEQLLLNISFKQPVRLSFFSILASTPPTGFSSSVDEDDSVSGPKLVKVYCNKSSLNFCGVVDEACAFSVLLSPEDILQERRIALPGSKFQMCSSVQIFIQENLAGSAYTFMNRMALFGTAHKRYS